MVPSPKAEEGLSEQSCTGAVQASKSIVLLDMFYDKKQSKRHGITKHFLEIQSDVSIRSRFVLRRFFTKAVGGLCGS